MCNTYLVLFHLSFEPWSRQILLLLLFFFSFYRFFPFNSHSSWKDILDVLRVKRIRSDVALTFKSIAGRNTEVIPRTNSLPFWKPWGAWGKVYRLTDTTMWWVQPCWKECTIGTKTQVKQIIFMKVMYILCTLGICLSFILVSSRAHFGIRPSKISENF